MTLIKSISGIRGTIGGHVGEGLNPLDIVKFTSAYATLIRKTTTVKSNKIVVGRDARISGEMVKNVVCGTLMGMGFDVVNIGLASTPTTELAVTMEGACGGIILTASHNPRQWNALKLLNEHGEFLNKEEGNEVLRIAEAEAFEFADIDHIGSYREDNTYNQKHIDSVLALKLVDVDAIRKANFRVAIDCVNSVGGIILPELLERLGVKHVEKLYCEATGDFQHNPEPLEKNLGDIMGLMAKGGCDVAFVVDPDVDRLAMICEDGKMYGEEYTLVTVADYVLKHTPGNTVSNLSSTRALRDVTRKYGCEYNASAVGEVNVVTKMKATNIFKSIVACGVGMSMLSGCLNLDEELYGRLSPETYYQTEEEALSSVVGVYQYLAYMSRAGGDGWRIGEFGTDEFFCPGRASGGWYDEANMQIMAHKITPDNARLETCWGTYLFPGIGAANAVLASMESSPMKDELKALIAETRALRAYGYYYAMDYFGNVPLFTGAKVAAGAKIIC